MSRLEPMINTGVTTVPDQLVELVLQVAGQTYFCAFSMGWNRVYAKR